MALKPLPRLILIASAVAAGWVGIDRYVTRAHAHGLAASAVPGRLDVPVAGTDAPVATAVAMTSTLAPAAGDYTARMLVLPWNAVAGLAYANGDATTAAGSMHLSSPRE